MLSLPEPILVPPPEPIPPRGHWLVRTLRAIVVERRCPTQVAEVVERLAVAVGLRCRTLTVDDPEGGSVPARLRVRRRTADAFFVDEVFTQRAYSPPGYEIGETDVVIDVGGNVGSFAVFAGRRARRGRVLTVEPVAESFDLLERNLAGNALEQVTPVRAAVSGLTGPVALHCSAIGTGHHSIDATLAGPIEATETVEGVTLADLVERFGLDRCDLLKLDCEGAEFTIVETLSPELAGRIRRIALEYHVRPETPKQPQADALVRRLIGLGYSIDRHEDHVGTNRGLIFSRRR